MKTAPNDRIWVGFNDQGIFGSEFGHSANEISANGLVCFDDSGDLVFGFNSWFYALGKNLRAWKGRDGRQPRAIDDCYGMNMATAADTWVYYYSDFPLVRITNLEVSQIWTDIPLQGSHSFAIHGGKALFVESYDEKNTVFLVNLDDMQVKSF